MQDFILFLWYSLALLLVMLIAEMAYKLLKLPVEWTRKIAHVGSGIIALTYPLFINSHWVVLGLTISFTIILYVSKKLGLFPSIFSVGRKSYGELLFVWSSWLLFWLAQYRGSSLYFYLPFAIVVFADPAAALFGTRFPVKPYHLFKHKKSLGGSLAFFIVAFLITYFTLVKLNVTSIDIFFFSFLHAAVLTLVEAVSFKGWDNFTIPVVSVLLLYLFQV